MTANRTEMHNELPTFLFASEKHRFLRESRKWEATMYLSENKSKGENEEKQRNCQQVKEKMSKFKGVKIFT
jgi:hypothetical protein